MQVRAADGQDKLLRRAGAHAASVLLGVTVACAVCWPWVGPGRLLTLDTVIGPATRIVPRSALGLDGGQTAGTPWRVVATAVAGALGDPGTWLPVAAVFPLAALGMWRVMRQSGLTEPACLVGSAFYCVNPWVLDRLAVGHIGLLLGYGLLPFLLSLLLHPCASWLRLALRLGLCVAVLIGMSVHFLWIAPVLVLIAVPCSAARSRGLVRACLLAAPIAGLCSAYLLIPRFVQGDQAWPGPGDLHAFRTLGSSWWHAAGNVVALQGFWRNQPEQPFAVSPSAYWFLAALLVLAGMGVVGALVSRAASCRLAMLAVALVVAGVLLSLGDRGPTGWLFTRLYADVPAFRVMREPQKFAMLVALGLSLAVGLGAELMLRTVNRRGAAAAGTCFLCGLVAVYSWPLFGGVDGTLELSRTPPMWHQVDEVLRGDPKPALVLPWHLYLGFPWTQGRTIANPAPEFLEHPVISGDDPELPGLNTGRRVRSERVTAMIQAAAAGGDVTSSLRDLQVRHVVLLKSADAGSYGWLGRQPEMRLVLNQPKVSVWELVAPNDGAAETRTSTSEYSVVVEQAGEAVLPEAYDAGWRIGSRRPHASDAGLTSFTLPEGSYVARYAPAVRARLLWALSVASGFVVLLLSLYGGGGRLRQDR